MTAVEVSPVAVVVAEEPDAWVSLDADRRIKISHDDPGDGRAVVLRDLLELYPERAERLRQRLHYRSPDYPGGRATIDIDDAIDWVQPSEEDEKYLRGDLHAVLLAFIAAEDVAARGLPAELAPPTQAALRGMVDVVLRADADRWRAMQWLEDQLAMYVLTRQLVCQLQPQAAARIIDRTLAALPPCGWDNRAGAARLAHAQVRAFRRALGARADEVREHLTPEWAQAVDGLLAEGPLDRRIVLARQWLADVETAEAYG